MRQLTIELRNREFFGTSDIRFASTLARLAKEIDSASLLSAMLVHRFSSKGHICVDLSRLAERPVEDDAGDVLHPLRWPRLEEWLRVNRQSAMFAGNGPLVQDGCRVYLRRLYEYQERLALQIRSRVRGNRPCGGEDKEPSQKAKSDPIALVLAGRVAVISGGPGTGKTTVVARVLDAILDDARSRGDVPPRILCVAPTGKAATRLRESLQNARREMSDARQNEDGYRIPEETATIHRALGLAPGYPVRMRYHMENPLPVDVLVVDEASMVDLLLMARLLEAVPLSARIILLGDKDQLASVDAGAVLGDICSARNSGASATVVTLTHSYRFGDNSGIGKLARAINRGDGDEVMSLLRDDDLSDVIWQPLSSSGIAEEASAQYGSSMAGGTDEALLEGINGFRILSPHRSGPFGVGDLNELVERDLSRKGIIRRTGDLWYPGRPVMVRCNDYQMGLFNGDVGVADEDARQVLLLSDELSVRAIPVSRMPDHETVYSMTVHKSQGSEFDRVAVVLPERISPVMTRELLYTAVTRARSRLSIFGTEAAVRHCVNNPTARWSGLADALRAP